MDIGDGKACFIADKTTDDNVLTDDKNLLLLHLLNRKLGSGVLAGKERGEVCGVFLCDNERDVLYELIEKIVLCDKVCLCVDFDDYADTFKNVCISNALSGNAAGLFLRCGKTLFTELVNSLVNIAVSFCECLLAVHHSDAGHFA